jgi:3',5'-cyclic-AMP phosphodiesterase
VVVNLLEGISMMINRFKRRSLICVAALILFLAAAFISVQNKAADTAPVTIKFVQITDDHFNPFSDRVNLRMVKYSKDLLEDAIAQINDMSGINFVIFTGDLADAADANLHVLFSKEANTLKVPWYWTTGNHDLSQSGVSLGRKNLLKLMNKYNKYIQPESTCYSFSKGGVLFFAMDGASDTISTAKGQFSKECLGFLDRELTAHGDMPAVIFQHFPLVYPLKSETHEVVNQVEYLALLDKHPNVKALFSGHYHVDRIQTRNNVLHVSSPALVQYPCAFRVVTLTRTGGDLKIDVKTVETRLKDVRKMSLESH